MEVFRRSCVDWDFVDNIQGLTQYLHRSISQYTRKSTRFKIGITSSPEARASKYSGARPRYDQMVVLYESQNRRDVVWLESHLIDWYWCYRGLKNLKDGGGGKSGSCPYYLYIVRKNRR